MELNKFIFAVAKGDPRAFRELYDKYRIPFYYIALSIIKNEDAALAVAAEAFRRIRDTAYRVDTELNVEYWLMDVLFTMCHNKMSRNSTVKNTAGWASLPELLKQEPAVFVKIYTDLGTNENAALAETRKAAVSRLLAEKKCELDAIRQAAEDNCPEYWDTVLSALPTGAESVPHNVRIRTAAEEQRRKKGTHYRWILAILLLVVFLSGAVLGIVQLVTKNYGSDLDKNPIGEDMPLQFNNNLAMTAYNGTIYFRGANNAFYKRDMASGVSEKISEDYPKELLNDGTYIYYRNNHDGYLYRISPDGGDRQQLCDVPGSAMALHEGFLYFSTKGGIYRLPSSGGTFDEAELLLDTSNDVNLYCVDLAVDTAGNVYFASGIGKGIHHITEYQGEPSVEGLFTEEAYTIQIDGDTLYFDYKEASGRIILYSFDLGAYLSGESETRVLPKAVSNADGINITLSTGAFYAENGRIYYAGTKEGRSTVYMLDEERKETELCRIDTGSATLDQNLHITDLYVSEEWVYCFGSDGKSNGKRIFFAGNLNTNKTVTIYES